MTTPIKGPLEIVEYRIDDQIKGLLWDTTEEGHRRARSITFTSCRFDIVRPWSKGFSALGTFGSSIGAIVCSVSYLLGDDRAPRDQAYANARRIVESYNLYDEMKGVAESTVPLIEKNIDYPYPNDRGLTDREISRAVFVVGVSVGFIYHLKKWFNIPTTPRSDVMGMEESKGR